VDVVCLGAKLLVLLWSCGEPVADCIRTAVCNCHCVVGDGMYGETGFCLFSFAGGCELVGVEMDLGVMVEGNDLDNGFPVLYVCWISRRRVCIDRVQEGLVIECCKVNGLEIFGEILVLDCVYYNSVCLQ